MEFLVIVKKKSWVCLINMCVNTFFWFERYERITDFLMEVFKMVVL